MGSHGESQRGFSQELLRREERLDQAMARRYGAAQRFGKSGRLKMQVSLAAVMNAVNTEGREVLTEAGKGYWEDMGRRHPHILTEQNQAVLGLGAMRNRFGRVAWRKVYR